MATPLFVVLVLVETTDLVFAVDSIPAIFAVTQDPFIVYTSNVFAILGLRALYFLLADVIHRFHYLKAGLSAVLVFVGCEDAGYGSIPDPDWGVVRDHRPRPRPRDGRLVVVATHAAAGEARSAGGARDSPTNVRSQTVKGDCVKDGLTVGA